MLSVVKINLIAQLHVIIEVEIFPTQATVLYFQYTAIYSLSRPRDYPEGQTLSEMVLVFTYTCIHHITCSIEFSKLLET